MFINNALSLIINHALSSIINNVLSSVINIDYRLRSTPTGGVAARALCGRRMSHVCALYVDFTGNRATVTDADADAATTQHRNHNTTTQNTATATVTMIVTSNHHNHSGDNDHSSNLDGRRHLCVVIHGLLLQVVRLNLFSAARARGGVHAIGTSRPTGRSHGRSPGRSHGRSGRWDLA